MHQILLVDDSKDCYDLISAALKSSFEVHWASNLNEAKALLTSRSFDLVLLDIMLPDGDGYQLCTMIQNLEQTKDVPVVFLTAKDEVTDKVMGFSLGADDYIVKPFQPLELRARVEGRLKKVRQRQAEEEVIWKNDLQINLSTQKAFIVKEGKKEDLRLTPIEFKVLLCLARRESHVFSRDQLLTAVWGENVFVMDRSVDTYISKLRKKLGQRSHYVQSIHGSGYCFSLAKT